ncbi:SusD/RagB family nutrient-binding outer membrane lipoprotein [Riemerella anatipestifer]|uniref:SusD/RagB family nutrient-binding outer membrane lipoprotein n=1 Tax=Riemerella anatipestifer TaxID=34085 RepID=A0AAP6HF78_RIEAN|nr:SusD/RagB family nutrient-binding outer membrane lipoprotein [Riemerella anatipestifer]MBT0550138.1 SusD/RagB family nutrient-binding outer membrane lipoprotein [Riemerella anatipestifer]MBT0556717.1 SusD/RagB family nutrient-binding outer membrane lipoprotein [Riemerella anatipestifer]MBT0560894.1 SusD/RagB family nutrient-binding outer membrane lipoprotein [Riemerella anatipestifer]MBT0563016.1 SusD/RagB family nutrient-binding outer membrane lipoprotein [Riemerella anatipestifer]MCO73555
MKKIIKITSILGAVALGAGVATSLVSCESDVTSLNDDPKRPVVVPSGNLVASAEQTLMSQIMTASVNRNIYRFFTQQWSQTTYVDESNYDMVTRPISRTHYNYMMSSSAQNSSSPGVLSALRDAKKFLATENVSDVERKNKEAVIELLSVYAWANLVDTFGDVPYFDALQLTPDNKEAKYISPKYDDAETIYKDLFARIDAAVANINTSEGSYSTDIIYGGNMSKWKKMGNSLKFKLALNIADQNPVLSKQMAEAAYSAGLFSSMEDNFGLAKFPTGLFPNPVYLDVVASGRDDYLPSDILVNTMNATKDPRRAVWFTTVGGEYKGGVYGNSNSFGSFSHFTSVISGAEASGYLLDFTEISFLRAEAAARGYSVGGTKEDLFASAIKASMTEYGVSAADITTYLANNTLGSNWRKSIGEQAWVAMFNRGYQAWNFTRRLDYPKFENPENSTVEAVPIRMKYSDQEYVLNNANVSAAASKLKGGDKVSSRIFWDIY